MGEVTPIEKPLDKEIEFMREEQRIIQNHIKQIESTKEGYLTALKDPAAANAEFKAKIESEIDEINKEIEKGKEAIRSLEISISGILDRMEELKTKKNPEIKIR